MVQPVFLVANQMPEWEPQKPDPKAVYFPAAEVGGTLGIWWSPWAVLPACCHRLTGPSLFLLLPLLGISVFFESQRGSFLGS